MTIAQRVILLVVSSIVCQLFLVGVNQYETRRVYEASNFGNENVIPSILILDKTVFQMGQLRVSIYRHTLTTDPVAITQLDEKISATRSALNRTLTDYEPLLADAKDKELLDAAKVAIGEYEKVVEQVLATSRQGNKDEAREVLLRNAPVAEKANAAINAQLKYNEDLGKKSTQDGAKTRESAMWIAISLSVITLIGLTIQGVFTLRSLTQRISDANRVAAQIASGDLTKNNSIPVANDELGQLIQSLDKMRNDLAQTISSIVANANGLVSSAGVLSTAANQASTSTESQAQSTASAAAAVEELTVSVDHIGQSAAEANNQANEAGALAIASGAGVDDATHKITLVSERVEHTAMQMQTLSGQVQEIGNITIVIREVADQTNLLALNAAIEAARAGEQGRGFAVVADEVRKLAERTTASVAEISNVISVIQTGASAALESMESSRQVVGEVVVAANEASSSMRNIRNSTETVQKSIQNISHALREQRDTSNELAKNVEAIAQMSEENSATVLSVAETANQLASLSDNLKASVSRFRL
jgi:methyl-accepting chemotaxis protein